MIEWLFKNWGIVRQLSRKFLILEDLNAHMKVLDIKYIHTNYTGRTLKTLLSEDSVCLINTKLEIQCIGVENL